MTTHGKPTLVVIEGIIGRERFDPLSKNTYISKLGDFDFDFVEDWSISGKRL